MFLQELFGQHARIGRPALHQRVTCTARCRTKQVRVPPASVVKNGMYPKFLHRGAHSQGASSSSLGRCMHMIWPTHA